jgi:uncharacterized membrane protein YdbT with pleckstrin-like domain
MNDEPRDYNGLIKHFQAINAANVTNTVNVLLTLSVGVIAFAVNILVNSKGPVNAYAGDWLIASFVSLFLDAFIGITILFTRLEDYRRTIQSAVISRDNPGLVNDEKLIKTARTLKKTANLLNRATNILLYVQPALFLVGFMCLAISVFITNGGKLS